MTMTTADAIRKHGAQAVYDAANRHLAGEKITGLVSVGLVAKSMGDVYRIQSEAYAELGDTAKTIDHAQVQAALTAIVKRGRPPGAVVGSMTARIEIRMAQEQREKLEMLGGAQWLRDQIDKAKG